MVDLAYPVVVTDGNNRPSKDLRNLIDKLETTLNILEKQMGNGSGPLVTLSTDPPSNPSVNDVWIKLNS